MAKKYTVQDFKDMSAAERRVRENAAAKRVAEDAKRDAKVWGKPAAASAGIAAFKFTKKK